MKLYTEEQVRKAIDKSLEFRYDDEFYSDDEVIESLTPIELPSDEEIKEYSNRYSTMHEDVSDKLGKYLVSAIHIDGANWMREQIYDGVRLKRFIKDEGEQINGAKWMKEQILNQNK